MDQLLDWTRFGQGHGRPASLDHVLDYARLRDLVFGTHNGVS